MWFCCDVCKKQVRVLFDLPEPDNRLVCPNCFLNALMDIAEKITIEEIQKALAHWIRYQAMEVK